MGFIAKIKRLFKRTEVITIYMKSGNIIMVDDVVDWEYKTNNCAITYIKIETKYKSKLKVNSLDLTQIEAIMVK